MQVNESRAGTVQHGISANADVDGQLIKDVGIDNVFPFTVKSDPSSSSGALVPEAKAKSKGSRGKKNGEAVDKRKASDMESAPGTPVPPDQSGRDKLHAAAIRMSKAIQECKLWPIRLAEAKHQSQLIQSLAQHGKVMEEHYMVSMQILLNPSSAAADSELALAEVANNHVDAYNVDATLAQCLTEKKPAKKAKK